MSLLIYGHSRSLVSPRPSGFRHEARRRGNYPPKSSRRPKRFLSLSAASVAPLHACIACLVSSPPHHADPSQCLSHPPRWNRSWVGERIHEVCQSNTMYHSSLSCAKTPLLVTVRTTVSTTSTHTALWPYGQSTAAKIAHDEKEVLSRTVVSVVPPSTPEASSIDNSVI